jgi:serine/threonine-protein kinase HipA
MNRLVVHLNGVQAGRLNQDDAGELSFAYAPKWLSGRGPYPLSRSLPLRPEPFHGKPVRAFFAGILPEQAIRQQVAANLGVSAGNDFGLLARIGGECAGAVSLLPEGTPHEKGDDSLRRLSERELRDIIGELPRRPLLAGEKNVRLSLAGAQSKLPVVWDADGFALPLGNTPSTHIIKPEPPRFPMLATNETLVMDLARAVGLAIPELEFRLIGDTPCVIVKRFDRELDARGAIRRVHQEDFCQALGVPPERKYQQEGGPTIRDCVTLLREWSTTPVVDLRAFVDVIIFNHLAGNADAHGKNFSLLYQGGSRRLAPFYDLVCTLAWPELSKVPAMKIGAGRSLNDLSGSNFRRMAKDAGLGWPMVRQRVEQMCGTIRRVLDGYERRPGMDDAETIRISHMIQKRCESLLARLES